MTWLSAVLLLASVGNPAPPITTGRTSPTPTGGSIVLGIESLQGPARGGPFAAAGVLLLVRRRSPESAANRSRAASGPLG